MIPLYLGLVLFIYLLYFILFFSENELNLMLSTGFCTRDLDLIGWISIALIMTNDCVHLN